MELQQNFLTQKQVLTLQSKLMGMPSENRVLIATPTSEVKTNSGLFIPGKSEDLPKKGVILQFGPFTELYTTMAAHLKIGDIVTYGLYAGKEVELPYLGLNSTEQKLTILSVSEILYIEDNQNK